MEHLRRRAAATSGAAEIVTTVGAGQAWLLWQCIELPERRFSAG
jgi:hypothetical protein